MKFGLKAITKTGRLGLISDVERLSGAIFETPLMILSTRGGTVSHLTYETLDMLENKESWALLLPHSSNVRVVNGTKESKMCISEFIGMKESLSVCTVSDPLNNSPTGFNNKKSVAVWTKSGRENVGPESYMDAMEGFRPDFYQSLCDSETDAESSKKRLQRSVKSSTEFFDYCLERHKNSKTLGKSCILASLVGGYCLESRKKFAKDMALQPVDGFLIDGFNVPSEKGEEAVMDLIIPLIKETVSLLPDERIRMLPGCWTPEALWSLVQEGIDVFDSSLPTIVAERGAALTFNFDPQTRSFSYTGGDNKSGKVYEISLAEDKYREEFGPLVSDCECITCKSHTKAYIHHLLTVKELLGTVLLMLHNLHHYNKFFGLMKRAIDIHQK